MNEQPTVKLILASASPRRLALLERAGLAPDLLYPVDVDETPGRRETPRALALRLALDKAKAAAQAPTVNQIGPKRFIVAADTVVAVGRRIVPKPDTPEDAARALKLLSGRSHHVYTAIAVVAPSGRTSSRVVDTKVRFKRLTREDLETYLTSGEWRGKAGAYAIQGRAESFVRALNGSHSSVVGLPLYETVALLEGAGYPVYQTWLNAATELV
ncbi:MAG: Maf family nucleotide pyrophosphatase [Hyphomicrobiales bacterium]